MHKDLPRLTAPRLEVERYLTIQIEKAKALPTFEASASGVDEVEKNLAALDLETIRILRDFFDSSDVADEYETIRAAQDAWTEDRKRSPEGDESSGRERPSAIQILNRRLRDTYATSVPARMKNHEERLRKRIQWLESFMTKRLRLYKGPASLTECSIPQTTENAVMILNLICSRFHEVAKELRKRHERRDTLAITDEPDVRDLLRALVRLYINDIRTEEPTPSLAGGSGRVDFFLKEVQVAIEVKKASIDLRETKVRNQLILAIERYKGLPDCKILYCFVYDPDGCILNPQAIENDLHRDDPDFGVIVRVAPKTH